MKYILYFSVLIFSSINVSSAASLDIHGYLNPQSYNIHEINVTDAANFSAEMMTSKGLDEASFWMFDAAGDYVTDDQFWIPGVASVDKGDLSAGDEGMYFIAASIFGMQPDSFSENMNDPWENFTFPDNAKDEGEYWISLTGVDAPKPVPAPPVLWLLSAGLLVFFRARKKLV